MARLTILGNFEHHLLKIIKSLGLSVPVSLVSTVQCYLSQSDDHVAVLPSRLRGRGVVQYSSQIFKIGLPDTRSGFKNEVTLDTSSKTPNFIIFILITDLNNKKNQTQTVILK